MVIGCKYGAEKGEEKGANQRSASTKVSEMCSCKTRTIVFILLVSK